ncbi:MAG: hypothetical protein A6F71_05845 [Cycloclasticus sp. symbiont of Poecilosclerida sp. M]|nr:MAG: hypothetical protein A6F71_05845 [Cycloclasticus sp. symbiont of Poecilosclerida sp. M]
MLIGSLPVRGAAFGEGQGRIILDDLVCNGSESTLINCPRKQNIALFESDCTHSEDAGVSCECELLGFSTASYIMTYYMIVCLASCADGLVRLLVSEDSSTFYMGLADYDATYYDKDDLRVGRVEVCYDGRYGAVCEDEWEDKEASVVCRQLGFSRYGIGALPTA